MIDILIVGAPLSEQLHEAVLNTIANHIKEDFQLIMVEREDDISKLRDIPPEIKLNINIPESAILTLKEEWRKAFMEQGTGKLIVEDTNMCIEHSTRKLYKSKLSIGEQS